MTQEKLEAVLAALAPDDTTDVAVPEDVLRAFAQYASADEPRSAGARALRIGRAAALKVAVAVLVLSSGTVAAAAADVLPGPAQRAAHSLFGDWGVPAPRKAQPHKTLPHKTLPSTPSAPAASPSAASPRAASPSASPSASPRCPNVNAHAANGHCEAEESSAASTDSDRATRSPQHGHTRAAHGGSAH